MGIALGFDDVTFTHRRGRRVFDRFSWAAADARTLLLGPNGAGKSTLLQLAAGLVKPQAGRVTVAADRSIGYMPQVVRAVPGLSVRDQVAYCAWLKGLSQRDARAQAAVVLAAVDLAGVSDRPALSMSGGQLRRVGVAQALVGHSGMMLLDEPTAGLDPAQRDAFARLVSRLGVPLLVASHQVEDIHRTYDEVAVLMSGAVVFHSTVADFLALDPSGGSDARQAYTAVVTRGSRAGSGS